MSNSKLQRQEEQPGHYDFLKNFRVNQCLKYPRNECQHFKPYTCFDWHHVNHRRRRPVLRRDGTFNYSSEEYCTQYNDQTAECPEGDACPLMHRIAGDCEYHFHLRYYKTSLCFFELNSHGFCTKYGRNCAFAHGFGDLRDPVKCDMEMQGKMTANLTRKAEKAATNFASSWGAQSQLFGEASGYDSSANTDGFQSIQNAYLPSNSATNIDTCYNSRELNCLRDLLAIKKDQVHNLKLKVAQSQDVIKMRNEHQNRILSAELERAEALVKLEELNQKFQQLKLESERKSKYLSSLSIQKLEALQSKLQLQMDELKLSMSRKLSIKCMSCKKNTRAVLLLPCNHYSVCKVCAITQQVCPYCLVTITSVESEV